jgi:hypothetical protein
MRKMEPASSNRSTVSLVLVERVNSLCIKKRF